VAAVDPVDAVLIPGFRTGRETLDILKVFAALSGPRVLDLGGYRGGSTLAMALLGKQVEALVEGRFWPERLAPILEPRGMRALNLPYAQYEPEAPFDGIWASHVLQNERNPGLFLDRCRRHLADDGWLAVVAPPPRSRITAGKVNPGWNLGALMYALLAAGFDLTRGHFVTHGFNVVAFVPKAARVLERPADAFADPSLWPFKLDARRGFEGDIPDCNWPAEFRERMATGLSELAQEGPEAALEEARRLARIWV
jgi:SAM-dependent methyltransferase